MHQEWITIGRRGASQRRFTITYTDDPPERAIAVAFFQVSCEHKPFPQMDFDQGWERMSDAEAQEYLDRHPREKLWDMLTIGHRDDIGDEAMYLVRDLPELRAVHIHSDRITDAGVRELAVLARIKRLVLYSRAVTDACLPSIARMGSLETLDLQGAPGVSRKAFQKTVAGMKGLKKGSIYPPPG
jgi:hypothetical protein